MKKTEEEGQLEGRAALRSLAGSRYERGEEKEGSRIDNGGGGEKDKGGRVSSETGHHALMTSTTILTLFRKFLVGQVTVSPWSAGKRFIVKAEGWGGEEGCWRRVKERGNAGGRRGGGILEGGGEEER